MGSFFSKKFDPTTDVPDLTGKVIIVTGGNTGIGYATVKHLARRGATVYLAARNESKATAAISSLETEGLGPGNGKVLWLKLDLSDPRLTKRSAEEFLGREKRLDVLINNAALIHSPYVKTSDGIIDHMMVNVISQAVFTKALLPLLTRTAQEPNSDVRIVNVSSDGHKLAPAKIRFRDLSDINEEYKSSLSPSFARYFASKVAFLHWSKALQAHLTAQGTPILVLAPHPGGVDTFSQNWRFPALSQFFMRLFFYAPDDGALTSVFCAAAPVVRAEAEKYEGAYLVPIGKVAAPSKVGADPERARETWETVERILAEIGV